MSDTVLELANGVSFTRFWGGVEKKDSVQITFIGECGRHEFCTFTYQEFLQAVAALKESVEKTKDAWWHHIK